MDTSKDETTFGPPRSAVHREGASMWLWDDAGRWGMPRMGVEAVGATWDTSRRIIVNLGLPDGRLLTVRSDEPPHPAADQLGRPRIIGGGPLQLQCVEPFRHWRLLFDGVALVEDARDLARRATTGSARANVDGERVPLRVELDARMAKAPWVQGTLDPQGSFNPGEHRFEQLFTAKGAVSVSGEEMSFTGGGLRIHRRGENRGEFRDWHGHCWQSALFPSGRAFGFMHYHPRPDGTVKYQEGWLAHRDAVVPIAVVETPWLTEAEPSGQDVSFTVRTPSGDVRIEAETFVSQFRVAGDVGRDDTPVLQSGITRCRWDDEESFGMIERSAYL